MSPIQKNVFIQKNLYKSWNVGYLGRTFIFSSHRLSKYFKISSFPSGRTAVPKKSVSKKMQYYKHSLTDNFLCKSFILDYVDTWLINSEFSEMFYVENEINTISNVREPTNYSSNSRKLDHNANCLRKKLLLFSNNFVIFNKNIKLCFTRPCSLLFIKKK